MKSKQEIKYDVAIEWGYINWGDLITTNWGDHDYTESAYMEVLDRYVSEVEKNYQTHYVWEERYVGCECGNCFKIKDNVY